MVLKEKNLGGARVFGGGGGGGGLRHILFSTSN